MDGARQNIPGVTVKTKTAAERIPELREAGQDTAWYDRGASARLSAPIEAAKTCSWFSIYLLDGEYAWTKNQDGTPYVRYRKLRKAVTTPAYYCSCCKGRWAEYAEAVGHGEVTA